MSEAAAGRLPRFGPTERTLHWLHAVAFFTMLATGLALYLPALAGVVGDRRFVVAVHLLTAIGWMTGLALVVLLGDRRTLGRTRRDLEHLGALEGRLNVGQAGHTIVQAALSLLLIVSGALLWLGERDHDLRLPSTIVLHDGATLVAVVLVAGHLVLALVIPATRPAMPGMTRGTVDAGWARRRHPHWTPAPWPGRAPLTPRQVLLAGVVVAAGAAAASLVT